MKMVWTFKTGLGYCLAVFLFAVGCETSNDEKLESLKICTEIRLDSNGREIDYNKAVADRNYLWPHAIDGRILISVKFFNGTEFQKRKVMQYARKWTAVSNDKIRFLFHPYDGSSTSYDVRITFNPGGSNSKVGTHCRTIPQNEPTMNFGWLDEDASEKEIQRVVLHEFGHVVGLVHEHMSPVQNIPWDKDKVYEYYWRSQNPPWDKEKVDANIFNKYSATVTNYTAYDKYSIMHYAIPKELTINESYETPWNTDLSPTDIAFIKELYPYRPCTVNDCCYDRRGRRVLCP